MDAVETLRLPLSGLLFQRRADGSWRCVEQAQHDAELAGHHVPNAEDWSSADAAVEGGGQAQRAPGPREGASWWLVYGDNRSGPVSVTLDDGQRPPILTFGPVWICEWVSPWQGARVTVGGETHRVFHRTPGYLRDR